MADLGVVLRVYLVSLVMQIMCLPMTRRLFASLPDLGYPLSRLFLTLVTSLTVWIVAHTGLGVNTVAGVWMVFLLIALMNVWIAVSDRQKIRAITKEAVRIMVIEEYLFVVGLVGISLIRGFAPAIDSLEKFMDFGFMNRYLVSPTLPVIDMWQAGEAINYYSFGHFWSSVVVRLFGVKPAVGYNLMLGFIAGTSLSVAFSISYYLTGAKRQITNMVGGLVGSFAVVVAGNTHVIWYLVRNWGFKDYWYADATRFIDHAIHEFASYSLVVADLHGHLTGLPFVLAFILIFARWIQEKSRLNEVMMGVLLGVMMMTNTWDMAVYGLLLAICSLLAVVRNKMDWMELAVSAVVVFLSMLVIALPWLMNFKSISDGVGLVQERSPWWQLLVLWSGGLIATVTAVLTERGGKQWLPVWGMALTAWLLVMIPEFIYVKDIYPNDPRANTMFKLTYQASVMIGVLFGVAMGKLLDKERRLRWWWRWPATAVTGVTFLGMLMFPAEAYPTYYTNFDNYKSLDGEVWLVDVMPERYRVIDYLRLHRDGKNLVEAVGDSYTNFNAISVFAGVPTIQGWRVHEWLWRGGYDSVAVRETEVREIYESSDEEKVRSILKKYGVGWIVVGEDERTNYVVNDALLMRIGKKVMESGSTYLIKI